MSSEESGGLESATNDGSRKAPLRPTAARPKSGWDTLKQRLASARITEALLSPKFFMNGRKFTALRVIGEGGYSTVFEVFDTDKRLYALKVVNLAVQSVKVRNDLIREIVFLEKLKQCSLVVRAFDYELRETDTEHKMLVLMEKGDRDLYSIMMENREKKNLTPAKLR